MEKWAFFNLSQERDDLRLRVARTENAVCNAVGPNASRYFGHLEKFLNRIPKNIMGLPWFQLKTVVDTEAPERFKQSKVSLILFGCFHRDIHFFRLNGRGKRSSSFYLSIIVLARTCGLLFRAMG
jgi:hypothetical protein